MFSHQTILLFLAFTIGFATSDSSRGTAEERTELRRKLFTNYDKAVIPDDLSVKFGLALIRFDVHPELDRFDTEGWLRYVWTDKRLAWDNETTNVDVLRTPIEDIWMPDITLYNSFESHDNLKCAPTKTLIYPNGEVLWVPPCSFKSICEMENLRKNPDARQSCHLKFGSWTYDGFAFGMTLYNNATHVDLSDAWEVPNWNITGTKARLNAKIYDCCPEPYYDATFHIEFEKKK